MATLEADGVVTGYGRTEIVHGITLGVQKGEIVCIIGPNGAGKSTFIKAVAGSLPIHAGSLRFDGQDITSLGQEQRARRGIGYVPQTRDVFPSLSTNENLLMGAYLLPKRQAHTKREAVLQRFPQLQKVLHSKAGSLSGGERKLLGIGRVLMASPLALLLDEPSAGLSPQYAETVRGHIQDLARDGHCVMIVEQQAVAGLEISDRGAVFVAGTKHYEGHAKELLDNEDLGQMFLGRR